MIEQTAAIEGWEQTQAGSTEAARDEVFDGLVERVWQRAYWTAYDILGDAAEAEDMCQDALLRAYERWDEFRHQAAPDTWVYRILINMCLNHRRRRGIWNRIIQTLRREAEDASTSWEVRGFLSPEQRTLDRETEAAIRRAMEKLSTNQRTVFVLRYFQDLTLSEIAELTGFALGTVKSHLFRALKTMRAALTAQQMKPLLGPAPDEG